MWLMPSRGEAFSETAPLSCGTNRLRPVRIETLAEAVRAPVWLPKVASLLRRRSCARLTRCRSGKSSTAKTRAVHAQRSGCRERVLLRFAKTSERHNALDKLGGALATAAVDVSSGLLAVYQPGLGGNDPEGSGAWRADGVAVSARPRFAIRTAEAAGITLVAIARQDGSRSSRHPQRIAAGVAVNVA